MDVILGERQLFINNKFKILEVGPEFQGPFKVLCIIELQKVWDKVMITVTFQPFS